MAPLSTLVLLDDNPRSLEMLSAALAQNDLRILTAERPEHALELIWTERPDLLITDLVMPGMNGLEVLDQVMKTAPSTEVVLMTAHYTTETAVAAIRRGAADYVEKPVKLPVLRERIARLLQAARVRRSVLEGRADSDSSQFEGILARSSGMWDMFSRIRRIGPHFRSVLLQGETGTGKELVADALHRLSGAHGLFVVLNCSAVVETLFESELFGHVKGAFTGAEKEKTGLFEHAHGGTLFLDEIGEMPMPMQAKLLRAVQNQEIQRVGSLLPKKVDVRIIAATNRDLRTAIAEGTFREDLFYRLSPVSIQIPPLRDRPDDIPLLVQHFLTRFAREHRKTIRGVTRRALLLLQRYRWPGNVRELENAIAHASMMADGPEIDVEDLPEDVVAISSVGSLAGTTAAQGLPGGDDVAGASSGSLATLAENERQVIARTVKEAGGNQSEAARRLGIGRDALRYKLKRHGLLEANGGV